MAGDTGDISEPFLHLEVIDVDTDFSMLVRLRNNTPFIRVMNLFRRRTGLLTHVLRFRFDGEIIEETDTPLFRGMDNWDTILVFHSRPLTD